MDAIDQAALVASGEVSPGELLEAAIQRIERIDPVTNAVVIRWFDHARDTAGGNLPDGPFRGVPFLIKDLFAAYAGQRISNGNVALKDAHVVSNVDTTLVSRHRRAGLVIAGRTNSPNSAACRPPSRSRGDQPATRGTPQIGRASCRERV